MNPAVVLSASGLVAGYVPNVDILNGVTIDVVQGDIVTVVGPNGAGKSTLLKAIVGLLRPRRGRITLAGIDLEGTAPSAIVRHGLAYVPQRQNVFETLTVQENLEVGLRPRPTLPLEARLEATWRVFPVLRDRRRRAAGDLSGGERQMLAMARALMPEPRILLLDEPTAGLAPRLVAATFDQIVRVNAAGVTILMVEQNARRALALSHRGYVLDLGRNAHEGPGKALVDDPLVASLYLGGAHG